MLNYSTWRTSVGTPWRHDRNVSPRSEPQPETHGVLQIDFEHNDRRRVLKIVSNLLQ
ncbi:MAG TPA: hypothetical protein VD973_23465 [Symbiobacteriaceae bacterium]|jgi:hypothetical protein|nr:hypothetical protein [Symbiobacteriaceae bacterium]